MEKLDVYDIDGNKTQKVVNRGEQLGQGEYIKLAIVYLKCGDKFLVQKCSVQKGGEYAITGGHTTSGNTSKQQAKIEVMEELGILIDEKKLEYLGNMVKGHGIFDVFLYEDISLEKQTFVLQVEEVENVFWLTKTEIENIIEQKLMRPSSCEHYTKFIKQTLN